MIKTENSIDKRSFKLVNSLTIENSIDDFIF